MIRYFENLQSEKRKSVIFANAKYEIEHKLLSTAGLKYIEHKINESNLISQVETTKENLKASNFVTKANPEKIDYKFEYSLPLNCNFTLFTLAREDNIKYMLGLTDNHHFSDEDCFPNISVEQLLQDEAELKKTFNCLIKKGNINLEYENGWAWVTCHCELEDTINDCQELINGLGLAHLCGKRNEFLYGLVLEIKEEIKLYKPTFMNYPSKIAYCTMPNKNKNRMGFGKTYDVHKFHQKYSEALLPTKAFKLQNVEIKRIFMYPPFETNNIEKDEIKNNIMDLLHYNSTDDYTVNIENGHIMFTKK